MLQHTFLLAPHLRPSTERELWENGARTWGRFLERRAAGHLPGRAWDVLARLVDLGEAALQDDDVRWFARRLPPREHWRLYEEFWEHAAFLDIETTGLSRTRDVVTVIALRARGETRTFVRGHDLSRFPRAVREFPLLVTFNGSAFDVPFLRAHFPSFSPRAHVDLRWPLARLGYRGGLKAVERKLGVARARAVADMDGWEAVRLWRRWERQRNVAALERLLAYARADVEGLPRLARVAVDALGRELGFARRVLRRRLPRRW
jgi:uncharacterized protein YprB with RNaseH-like and TPR domain